MIRQKHIIHFLQITGALLLFFSCSITYAQKNEWDSLTSKFAKHRNNTLQEKIFTHLDRTLYVAGENMWFKVNCVDAYFHRPLDVSKVAYLEILDKDNKAVIQTKVSLDNGEGNGQLLLPVSLSSGNYLVRVYTTWMKNFNPDYYFQQPITIVNTVRKSELPAKNVAPEYDIQFFPEGGQLVDGIMSTVAFRIVDQSGNGQALGGALLNQRGDTVVSFKPLKFGIGKFSFLPASADQYKVVLQHKRTSISFPVVQTKGYVLHATDTLVDQLKITIRSKGVGSSDDVYLIIHSRQILKIAQLKSLNNGGTSFLVDKNNLEEGISHITVFDETRQPVCERLYFKQPQKKLTLMVSSDAPKYTSRKKIKLDVHVSTPSFKSGSFSMTVFREDSLAQFGHHDIQQYELLTSDLKGNIESPDYYFSDDSFVKVATDNLMLTHGWSRFKWEEVLRKETSPMQFSPEYRGHRITATVSNNQTGAPANSIPTFLSTPSKNILLYGSISNAKGSVEFDMRDFYDKRKIFIQTDLTKDSIYSIRVHNPYSETFSTIHLPLLSYTSSWKHQLISRSLSMQIENTYHSSRILVENPVVDSTTFYGVPDEKYLLDDYTRFGVMEEVMREYVKGVWVRKKDGKFVFKVPDAPRHEIFENKPLVMLDGIPVFDVDKIMAFSPLKVQKLDVMTRKYFLGPFLFEGIVSYTTYKGDLGGFEIDPKVVVMDYQGLQLQKEFFSPRYETPTQSESRLADRRNLLFWTPDIKLTGQENKFLEFYSSDEPGIYKIVIQGLGLDGLSGSATSTFEVSGPENN